MLTSDFKNLIVLTLRFNYHQQKALYFKVEGFFVKLFYHITFFCRISATGIRIG